MRQGADWYQRFPALFLGGIQGLTAKQVAVYGVVLELIYLHGGSVNNSPRWIAGWIADMGSSSVRRVIAELVALGKLTIEGDQITQKKATEMVRTKAAVSRAMAEVGREGGIASGVARREKPEKPQENRGETVEKPAENSAVFLSFLEHERNENNNIIEAIREDKIREEDKEREPIGSPKKNPQSALPFDPGEPDPDASPAKVRRATAIPSNWVPSDRNLDDAHNRNFREQEIRDEADRFRDHHLAKGSTFKDWDAAWRTWLGNARRFAGRGMAGGPHPGGIGQRSSIASVVARRRAQDQN